jgi:hypothetical protein
MKGIIAASSRWRNFWRSFGAFGDPFERLAKFIASLKFDDVSDSPIDCLGTRICSRHRRIQNGKCGLLGNF